MDRMGWLSMRGEIFVVAIIEDHWYVLMYQLPSRAELTCSYAVQNTISERAAVGDSLKFAIVF